MYRDLKKIMASISCALLLFVISASPSSADAELAANKLYLGTICKNWNFSYKVLSGY